MGVATKGLGLRDEEGRIVLVGIPALVLVICLVASFVTRGSMANLSFLKKRGAAGGSGGVGAGRSDSVADGGGAGSTGGVVRGAGVCARGGAARGTTRWTRPLRWRCGRRR